MYLEAMQEETQSHTDRGKPLAKAAREGSRMCYAKVPVRFLSWSSGKGPELPSVDVGSHYG